MKYLRQYIRRVLKESGGDTSSLAVLVSHGDDYAAATIYDVHALEEHLPALEGLIEEGDREALVHLLRDEIVRGYIEVGEPEEDRGPCRSAWEVKRSAGPLLGSVVYGVGFALSPSGLLIPDRGYVSPSASGGWEKQASKRKRHPLDPTLHHNPDGTLAVPHENHTDDRSDDCATYGREGREHLDYAYEARGDEGALLDSLEAGHARAMSRIASPGVADALDYLIDSAGQMFFIAHFT